MNDFFDALDNAKEHAADMAAMEDDVAQRDLAVGNLVEYEHYGATERSVIQRIKGSIVWLDNGRWKHAVSVRRVESEGP
jgi:hypothetical protein